MKPRDDRASGHGVPRVMASAPSVVQQARLMDAAGTAWHAVKCGNLEMITKLFPVPCNVYARGPVGENVMHVAMLLNTPSTLAITRYLVKLYGRQLVNCPIQERKQQHDPPGTYEGQTALHIAIVNRDFDMVKFLVQNGADIRARAWGTFFRQGGPMYYGEYALSFAACTGQKDVVAYLRRHGAQVNTDCDEFGNTALHMCVIHDQADMYDFLVDYCAASEAVRNHGGLTPLCLAAQLGKVDMLQHVYNRRRRAFYSFGKVTSYSLSLREIDTVQDEDEAAGPDGGYVPNALEAVLRKRHLDMLQEPLLTLLLQHKWEKFARHQFVVHFLGYLLLEVSQTILIWLHSSPGMWNGPGRASQEFLGIILALALLAVEVLDYANWSRECYHRRLTMTVHKEVDPPLYPIPGEMRDARDNRQGLFARLSARMGFAANSSGTQQSAPGGWQQRSEGGLGTPRAAAAAAAAAAVAPRGISHPGAGFGLSGTSPSRDLSNSSETAAAAAAGVRPQGATAHRLSFQATNERQQQQPPQPPSPPRGAGARRTATASSPRTAAVVGAPGTPSNSTAGAGAAGTLGAVPSSPSRAGGGAQLVSPTRSTHQIHHKSHDDPIDLRPRIGNVIGEGTSAQGVGVVDTGYGTLEMAYAGDGAAAAAGETSGLGSTSVGLRAGPGPVAEATEGEGDDEIVFAAQQQPQQPGTLAAAYSQVQRMGATGEPLAISATSSRLDDDDEGFDPVSVGLGASRMRSQSHLSAGLSIAAQHSTASAAAAAAASAAAASAAGGGEAAGALLPTVNSGSGAGGRSVTFSEGPNALLMARAASGRMSSPRLSGITQQQQTLQQQQQQNSSPFTQQLQASAWHSADGSSSGSPAAAGGLAAEAAAGRNNFRGPTVPLLPAGSSSAIEGTAVLPAGIDSSSAAARPAAAAAAGARPSGVAASSSFNKGIPRAKSFHGIGAGMSGVSSLRQGLVTSDDGGWLMTRAQTAGDDMLQNLATSSTPADPVEAVQMLERQRTRARSGGGDLPAALALKRTPASKKERPSSVLSGRGLVAAADGVAEGAGGGGGGGREGGSLATASTETGSIKAVDMEKGPVVDILDPHKSRLRAMLETTYEGAVRMLEDPWLFIWHLHLLLTCMHFLIWISSYGWVGGNGPNSTQVREFDDIIVSMMGLSGWLAVIYFFRGLPSTGKLAVLLERCIIDVVKFVSLYVLWNLGFTLAFFTMQNGVLSVAPNGITRNTQGLVELSGTEPDPFSSIGNTMVTLVNLGSGLSHYEYAMTCKNSYVLSSVLCTIYYLLYMATVVLLLLNLLIAMIIKTWGSMQEAAESYWRHRWAIYVIKAERRLPRAWVQRLRLGQLTYDPVSDKRVHSHVFETVDEDKAADSSKTAVEGQIKAVEQLLEELRKRRGSSS